MKNYDILKESETSPPPKWRIFWDKKINPRKKTKRRRCCVPVGIKMREIQGVLKNRIQGLNVNMPSATGFRKGVSIVDSVLRHQSRFGKKKVFNRFVVILDIKNAYRSVRAPELASVLAKINPKQFSGYKRTIAFIENFCFDPEFGGVAMGACASNNLFNVYCEHYIDQPLREICKEFGLTYTRYVDDLMFSSQKMITASIRNKLRQVLIDAGFQINDKKARVYDLRKGPVNVNGIGITFGGKTFMPREILCSLRGMIYCSHKDGEIKKELIHYIHGWMGLFKQMTDLSKMNSTERKLFQSYQKLRGIAEMKKTGDEFDDDEFDF
jgi:hypothetical protein